MKKNYFILLLFILFSFKNIAQNSWTSSGCTGADPTLQIVMVNTCGVEHYNEFILFSTGSNAYNPSNLTVVGSNGIINQPATNPTASGFSGTAPFVSQIVTQLNTWAGCGIVFQAAPNPIPPNSLVMAFNLTITGGLQGVAPPPNLAGFCGKTVYVMAATSLVPISGGNQGVFNDNQSVVNPVTVNFGSCQTLVNYGNSFPVANGQFLTCDITNVDKTQYNNTGCFPTTCNVPDVTASVATGAACISTNSDISLNSIVANATGGAQYLWTGPNNFSSNQANPVIGNNGLPQGNYTYTLKVATPSGCHKKAMVNVTIGPPLDFTVNDITVCGSQPVAVAVNGNPAPSSGATYKWESLTAPTSIISSNTLPIITITAPVSSNTSSPALTTSYSVTVTETNGCVWIKGFKVTTIFSPPPTFVSPTWICTGLNGTLSLTSTYNTYIWSNGSTNATLNISNPSTYSVTVTDTNGCISSNSITIPSSNSPSYGVEFSNPIVLGSKFRVGIKVSSICSVFSMGHNNFRLNYNASALANPTILSDAFPSPSFSSTTTTGTNTTVGILTVNTSYNGNANANILPIPLNGIELVILEFDIIDANLTSNLQWRINTTPKTTITIDDKLTSIPNSFAYDLDVPLKKVDLGQNLLVNCLNPNATLNATIVGEPSINYLWTTNEINAVINVSPTITTTYRVTATYRGVKAIDEIEVIADKTPPMVNLGPDLSVDCISPNVIIYANGNYSFFWNTGFYGSLINVSPTVTTTYIVTATANNGCTSTDALTVEYKLCYPVINIKAFLSNVDISTGLMDNYLASLVSFPTTDPYLNTPFNSYFIHVNNTTTSTINPSLLTNIGNNSIVDWVFLELRTGSSGSTSVVATKAALLQRDGDIVDIDGVSAVSFTNTPPGNYYIVVRHRNHLGFRTASAYYLSKTPTSLNFTNSSVSIFGTSPYNLFNNIRVMNSGDIDPDGSIDALDAIIWEAQNGVFDSYPANSDNNLDGSVDAFDTILWELNNGKFQELD